jgi:PAS domain S-box-containing protein
MEVEEKKSREASSHGHDLLEKRPLLWSSLGLGMLIVMGLIGIWTLRQVDASDAWMDHTREVIDRVDRLMSVVKDAESSQRGYLLTGDEGYLVPYHAAGEAAKALMSELTLLTADNPTQQLRLRELQPLIAERMDSLADVIRARNQSGLDAARQIILTGRGRLVMEQIGDVGQQIANEEYKLLLQRARVRKSRVRGGFAASLIAALLALLALVSAPFDVTRAIRQRKLAEESKQESESTARALFEAAAQAIFIIDKDGRMVMVNPSAEKILGYSVNELLGKPIEILIPDALHGAHVEHRKVYFEKPQQRSMGIGLELQAKRRDGSQFFAEISLSYIRTGRETLAVAFLTDISKRRADEIAIRQQKDDLRLLAGRLMTAQDDERRRIARDLHDDLSQKLAYLAMDIGKILANPASQPVTNDLRPLQVRAAEAAETVRHISHQLHPSILDDIGLEAAIEQYCEEFQARSGIVVHFSSGTMPDSIPRDVARSMYHIFQECLRNVSKHAKTLQASVRLDVIDGQLRLTVKDEGVGLKEERSGPRTSIGLIGMKERALLVNGTLNIQSQAGAGTEVTVTVPLSVAA